MRRTFKERSRSPGRSQRSSEVLSASALLEAARRARQQEEASRMNASAAPICQHFLQNMCKFGDRCTKTHPGGVARQQFAGGTPICAHFLQGRCAYGANCNKTHLGAMEARQRASALSSGMPTPTVPPPMNNINVGVPPSGVVDPPMQQLQQVPQAGLPNPAAGVRGYYEFVGKRIQGILKSFSAASGYGFISCPQSFEVFGRDIYALADQIGNLVPGHVVSFELFLNSTGHPQARGVVPETVFHGYIKSFNPNNGYGFISCAETFETFHRDVFVNQDQIGDLKVGQEVKFTIILTDRKQPQVKALVAEVNGTFQRAAQSGSEEQYDPLIGSGPAAPVGIASSAGDSSELYDPFADPDIDAVRTPADASGDRQFKEKLEGSETSVSSKPAVAIPECELYDPFA